MRDYNSRKIIELFEAYHKKNMNQETLSIQINPMNISQDLALKIMEKYNPFQYKLYSKKIKEEYTGEELLKIIYTEEPKKLSKGKLVELLSNPQK